MKKKIILILSVIFIVISMGIILLFLRNDSPKINYTEDEVKFKDEYENLNGQELAPNYILKNVEIDIDNNVNYVGDDDILDLLTNGTNIIYFGWSDCNWCRSIVPVLIESINDNNIDNLYYYDFKSLRNIYENNTDEEKNKLYEDILAIIEEKINSYFGEESNRSGMKKILAPTVVFIKDGKLLGVHVKSVDSQINSTDDLSKEQKKELKEIYSNYIEQLNVNVCYDEGC